MGFLDRIKEKPSHVKTQYAFVASVIVTLLIAVIWFSTLSARFTEDALRGTTEEQNAGPSVTKGIGAFLSDAKDQLGALIKSKADTQTESTNGNEVPIPDVYEKLTVGSTTLPEASVSTSSVGTSSGGGVFVGTTSIRIATTTKMGTESTTPSLPKPITPQVIKIGTSTIQKSE
jgi:hypothetical protein